jgi:hypothetical protein
LSKETPHNTKLESAAKAMLSMCGNLGVDLASVVEVAKTMDWI